MLPKQKLSKVQAAKTAADLILIELIASGKVNKKDLIEFMRTPAFIKQAIECRNFIQKTL